MSTTYLPMVWGTGYPVKIVAKYNSDTLLHAFRTAVPSFRLARAMGEPVANFPYWFMAGLLHDIGKTAVDPRILEKSGRLSNREWEIVRRHPEDGFSMLEAANCHRVVLDVVRYHHERWDGEGYPYGLSGNAIPRAARIFAVVDVWDALSQNRPYRKAWSEERVMDFILSQKGKHFDPQVADVFLGLKRSSPHLQWRWSRLIRLVLEFLKPSMPANKQSSAYA